MSSTVFFSPTGEKGRDRQKREERARRICSRCEVVEACATMALDYKERYGVWGGMSAGERRDILGTGGPGAARAEIRAPCAQPVIVAQAFVTGNPHQAPERPGLTCEGVPTAYTHPDLV
jgi:WhiB family redox-sensing transcriptional regulator